MKHAVKGVHETALESVKLKTDSYILDCGCGDGDLARDLMKTSKHVYCCDRKPLKLHNFTKADLNETLPYKNNFFDVVFCIEVIEHLKNPSQLVDEIHRVLKPGGILVLTTPNVDSIYSRLYFLCTGRILFFDEKSHRETGHITPVFSWSLAHMIEHKLKIEKITYNRGFVPLLRIEIPFKNSAFGEIKIMKLRKK